MRFLGISLWCPIMRSMGGGCGSSMVVVVVECFWGEVSKSMVIDGGWF